MESNKEWWMMTTRYRVVTNTKFGNGYLAGFQICGYEKVYDEMDPLEFPRLIERLMDPNDYSVRALVKMDEKVSQQHFPGNKTNILAMARIDIISIKEE